MLSRALTWFQTAENRSSKKGWRREGALARFLQLDGRILSFDAYWDDRDTEYGYLHLLKVLYYLADDTMEVRDVTDKDHSFLIVRRSKLPKEFTELGGLGRDDPVTLLNVLGPTVERSRSLADPLDLARDKTEYFKHNNLTIGAVINVFGRRVVLTDCDNFTKEFYRVTYGLGEYSPLFTLNI
ncbi:hypothetical protein AAG570_000041 [Ranatra chinensis]|uniref:DM10 domain-containing protein n=1 Tax=Ranatra chinensis TaxID=642074 RepID=A0ABD0YVY1_9HEMI